MEEKTWFKKLISFLRLTHEQEDHEIVRENIEKGVVFRGTNLWILIFAILVASVGLNMNSTAVVIGAMLISPLMGPINGVGYSVATYDFKLLRKALYNFTFATTAALITSTVYFALTPIRTEHAELLSRTSPTIYDVLIALFGGLAGIVATTSTTKGNVIPGVAIATALMPPLCTAGYGLAVLNWAYFFGALYLYVINSVFIALSAMLVSQILKFPRKSYLLSREIKNKNIVITIVIALTVLPSIYFGYTLVVKEKFRNRADNFISKVGVWSGSYLLDDSVDPKNKKITLVYGGAEFGEESNKLLMDKAVDLNLEDAKIEIQHVLKPNDFDVVEKGKIQMNELSMEVGKLKSNISQKQYTIDSLKSVPKIGRTLLKEINAIYPEVEGCSYSESLRYVESSEEPIPISIVNIELSDTLDAQSMKKIKSWLETRLETKAIKLSFEL